ncbi:RadC family protein [Niabella digestorum]|uniref:DNA repair protein RadC n=1 Tax=Niabella digestorum TaxID=3117701 RepID=A0ABU7RFL0_9BACT
MKTTSIKQWPKDDRPREKLLLHGPQRLSNSELLAILIHNGTAQKSALDLAKEVLQMGDDNINKIGKLSIKDLMRIKGIGEAKAITIAAALELGRRRQQGSIPEAATFKSSQDAALFLKERLKDYTHEIFAVLYLNRANKLISFDIISEGGITGTVADPRIILKKALEKNAVNIILSHNHPSGNLQPSKADELLTAKMRQAAQLLDITILDHIIVSDLGYYSFADNNML